MTKRQIVTREYDVIQSMFWIRFLLLFFLWYLVSSIYQKPVRCTWCFI